jgi:hypothetical protein
MFKALNNLHYFLKTGSNMWDGQQMTPSEAELVRNSFQLLRLPLMYLEQDPLAEEVFYDLRVQYKEGILDLLGRCLGDLSQLIIDVGATWDPSIVDGFLGPAPVSATNDYKAAVVDPEQ